MNAHFDTGARQRPALKALARASTPSADRDCRRPAGPLRAAQAR
jgi:hypothetical protein